MHARLASMIVCVSLPLALTGCGGGGSTPAAPSNPSPPPSSGGGSTITIPAGDGYGNGSSTFTPGSVTVPVGGNVTWTNRDSITHVSAASSGNLWSATLEPGDSFTRTFAERGTFNYRCTIHAGMSGTVTVQ